jgi:hypothetical protein
MNKNKVIFEIFDFLKQRKIVDTEGEFSEGWLGQCDSYYRGLRFKKTEPTLGVIAICASRLKNAAEQLTPLPRYHNLAEELEAMSRKCRALVDADSVEFELAD